MIKLLSFLSQLITLISIFVLFNFTTTIYNKHKEYPTHVHTTLFLDRNFDDTEKDIIIEAALEWGQATNGIVEYDIVELPTKNKVDLKSGVLLVKVSPDYPDIQLLDQYKNSTTLGYFEGRRYSPYIEIVADRISTDKYKAVVLHELGHSLGLEHLEGLDNADALMYPYTSIKIGDMIIPTGSDHVTEKDLIQFCSLYHCNASKLKN